MKKTTLLLLAALSAVSLRAQTFTEWHDSEVNQINRAPMHAYYKIFDTAEAAQGAYCDKDYPYRMSLNGASTGSRMPTSAPRTSTPWTTTTRRGIRSRCRACGR